MQLTELLLDDLENLLLVKLLGKTLDSGQSLTTIAFCAGVSSSTTRPNCNRPQDKTERNLTRNGKENER